MLIDPKIFDDLAKKLSDVLPSNLTAVKKDLEKNFHHILQGAFSQLHLVSQEEFEAQKKVLATTRNKVTHLEKIVADLEQRMAEIKPIKNKAAHKKSSKE